MVDLAALMGTITIHPLLLDPHEFHRCTAEGECICQPHTTGVECELDVLDCLMSEWGEFGQCSQNCVGGYGFPDKIHAIVLADSIGEHVRVRTILTEPANGGQPCGNVTETQPCNEDIICTKKSLVRSPQFTIR